MTIHSREFVISGHKGGGGGGKGKSGGSDTQNSIRSKARAQLVELISEGPIKGLVNGAKSIFFAETAVENSNGSLNYKNVKYQINLGLPDDQYFNGNTTAQTPYTVDAQVKKNVGPVIRTVNDVNADAVRIIVRIPSLVKVDSKDGSLKPTSLSYKIKIRNYNGNWVDAEIVNINNEKTSSPYQRQHIVNLPAGGAPWDIAVERITDDSTSDKLSNDLYFDAFYTIVKGKFIYPNSACIYLDVNAEDMGSSIPARAVEVEGLIVQVPSNYNPETRTYTGFWDGSFKNAYTNNPAWVFYDIVTNDRFGLGEFVNEALIDKWSLYQIAQYCDQMVDTGFRDINGVMTQEPRFTFNGVINSREEAFNVLRNIATTWRGMSFWSLGQVYAFADMPEDPSKLLAPANVLGGEFEYQGVGLNAMHSVALVSWNNPDDFYRPATEVVINEEMLKRYGWRERQVQLYGCTSRGQAHRYGKWVLDTEQHETETVTFTTSWDNANTRPGQIVAIADPAKAQVRLGGRLVECASTYAKLDFGFDPKPGETYSIIMVRPDGTVVTKPVMSFEDPVDGKYSKVNFAAITGDLPQRNAMWVITGSDVAPRLYRILAVREEKPNEFKFTGLFHDPTKYARVESGINLSPPTYTRPSSYISTPTNLTVAESEYLQNGTVHKRLLLSWSNSGDYLAKDYVVTMDHPSLGSGVSVGITAGMSIEISDVPVGEFKFYVASRGYVGNLSTPATITHVVTQPTSLPMPEVANIELADNPGSLIFTTSDVSVRWVNLFAGSSNPTTTAGALSANNNALFAGNKIKVYDAATNTILRELQSYTPSVTYTALMNKTDNQNLYGRGPSRQLKFVVTVMDIYGRESAPAELTLTNPPPSAITLNATSIGSILFANWTASTDSDVAGYIVHASTVSGFTPDASNIIYDGVNNSFSTTLTADQQYYIVAAAYDRFGKSGLNYSAQTSVSTGVFVDIDAPATPTNLSIGSAIRTEANGAEYVVLTVSWDANSESDLAYYDLQIKENGGNYISFPTSTNSFEIRANSGATYIARIRAVDASGNASANSAPTAPHTAATAAGVATAINSGTTKIDPGKITISGATTLADWRKGGDETKIDGGNLAANTVKANSVEIGLRNISLDGIEFEHNSPTTNSVAWTAGSISYVNDAGNTVTAAIASGNGAWTSGVLYIYWTKGATTLSATNAATTAFGSNNVVIASYRGGTDLNSMYGRTIIDGGKIKTGSIQAAQIAANSIDATKLNVTNLSAISATLGNVDISNANIGTLTVNTSNIQLNAVTASSYAYTGAADSQSTGSHLVQTVTVSATTGSFVNISGVFTIDSSTSTSAGSPALQITAYRNGVAFWSSNGYSSMYPKIISLPGGGITTIDMLRGMIPFNIIDSSPVAGNNTYTIYVTPSNATISVQSRIAVATAYKR